MKNKERREKVDRLWNLEKYGNNTAIVEESGIELTYEQLSMRESRRYHKWTLPDIYFV